MRSLTQMRQHARSIFDAALKAADPTAAVKRHLRVDDRFLEVAGARYDLPKFHHVYVVGAGKAAALMAGAVEEILGQRISSGLVIVKYGHSLSLRSVEILEAGHPIPDEAGVAGARRIIDILAHAGKEDLVLALLSGGASALLPCPADGLTLADKQQTTQSLLDCGATIHEINAVRKHISKVKGGRLAWLACPATLISLILSDVIGDALESIASGPTVADTSRFSDCLRIIGRYELQQNISPAVKAYLERGASGEVEETAKAGDPLFQNVQNVIVGNNHVALEGAKRKAEALGYNSLFLSSFVQGETRVVAGLHTAIAKEILATGNPIPRPACVISGGETTVKIRGAGLGGRNQEFALAAAIDIDGVDGVVVLSGGTDGTDGPTDAAGAIVDGTTLRRAREKGLDANEYLARSDSYHFLRSTGDLLITGPTFTNVMDLRVMLVA